MYNLNSVLITMILFLCLVLAIEAGYRVGRRFQDVTNEVSKSKVDAIQASLLGVLALILGFTFSLSLQRYDSRSEAVVDEANAIGTTYLRAQLLPVSIRNKVQIYYATIWRYAFRKGQFHFRIKLSGKPC